MHLYAKDKYEKDSSKDANIEQLCICDQFWWLLCLEEITFNTGMSRFKAGGWRVTF